MNPARPDAPLDPTLPRDIRATAVFLYILASRVGVLGDLEDTVAAALEAASPPFVFENRFAGAWAIDAANRLAARDENLAGAEADPAVKDDDRPVDDPPPPLGM